MRLNILSISVKLMTIIATCIHGQWSPNERGSKHGQVETGCNLTCEMDKLVTFNNVRDMIFRKTFGTRIRSRKCVNIKFVPKMGSNFAKHNSSMGDYKNSNGHYSENENTSIRHTCRDVMRWTNRTRGHKKNRRSHRDDDSNSRYHSSERYVSQIISDKVDNRYLMDKNFQNNNGFKIGILDDSGARINSATMICDDYSVVSRIESCLHEFGEVGKSVLKGQSAYQMKHMCLKYISGMDCMMTIIKDCPDLGPGDDAKVLLDTLQLLCVYNRSLWRKNGFHANELKNLGREEDKQKQIILTNRIDKQKISVKKMRNQPQPNDLTVDFKEYKLNNGKRNVVLTKDNTNYKNLNNHNNNPIAKTETSAYYLEFGRCYRKNKRETMKCIDHFEHFVKQIYERFMKVINDESLYHEAKEIENTFYNLSYPRKKTKRNQITGNYYKSESFDNRELLIKNMQVKLYMPLILLIVVECRIKSAQ
ncbi:unnamed protein product [Gordionus sp. m RMFG-2023]